MRYDSMLRVFLVAIVLNITLFNTVPAQSGRGRPTVPTRQPPAPPPPPVKVPEATSIVEKEQAAGFGRFVLKNGITVLISEQYSSSIVALTMHFRARPERGVLIEQALFGETGRIATGIRSLGGSFTSGVDFTGAWALALLPPEKINTALAVNADSLQRLFFGEERKATADYRPDNLNAALVSALGPLSEKPASNDFRSHLGKRRTAEAAFALTASAETGSLAVYCRPENLIISIAGAVSPFTALTEIQKLYAGAAVRPPSNEPVAPKNTQSRQPGTAVAASSGQPVQETSLPPRPTKLSYSSDRADISGTVITVGFPVAGPGSREWPALDLLAIMAGHGKASRLSQSLFIAQRTATRVAGELMPVGKEGLLTLQVWPRADVIDKAESELFATIDRLRREPPSPDEISRAKALAEKGFIDRFGPLALRSRWLATMAAAGQTFGGPKRYLEQLRQVTAEDVLYVAAKYLNLNTVCVHEYQPDTPTARTFDSDGFASTVAAWAPGLTRPVNAVEPPPRPQTAKAARPQRADPEDTAGFESLQALAVKDFSTLNGPRVYVREDHSQPRISIAILFQGGRASEDPASSGKTELMLRTLLYGSERTTAADVAQGLEQLGGEIEVISEPDIFGIELSVPSRNAEASLSILRDMIEEPAFRDEDVERARIEQIGVIQAARDSALERPRELLFQSLFPGHAYSLPPHGIEPVVAKLTAAQLKDWHAATIKRQYPLALIIGDTQGSALVSGELAERLRRRDVDKSFTVKGAGEARSPGKPEIVDQRRSSETVQLIGYPGPRAEDPDLATFELLSFMMNGSGGRLAGALAGKGISGSAGFNAEGLLVGGAVYVLAAGSAGSEAAAQTAIVSALEQISSAGPTAGELDLARSGWALQRQSALQDQHVHSLKYAQAVFNRLPPAGVDDAGDAIAKVSADDLKRLASKYFKKELLRKAVIRGSRQ